MCFVCVCECVFVYVFELVGPICISPPKLSCWHSKIAGPPMHNALCHDISVRIIGKDKLKSLDVEGLRVEVA